MSDIEHSDDAEEPMDYSPIGAGAVEALERLKIENAMLRDALAVHGLPWVVRSIERRMADRAVAAEGQ